MARIFAVNIDLAKNQLINARIHNAPSSAKPANPGLGQVYFDTTDNFLYFWNGTIWLRASGDFGAGGETTSLTFGNTKSDGVSTSVARADHTHEIPDIVGTENQITVSKNETTGDATISLPNDVTVQGNISAATFTGELTGNADTASTLETARTISLAGDVVGSVSFDGSQDVEITATVQPNSVELGTDTTGSYVQTISVSGNGLSKSGGTGESEDVTISSNATANNTPETIVYRDAEGDFAAREISAERVIISGTPTSATDAATKGYVDGLKQGLDVKESVKLATTENIALDNTTVSVDGITLVSGDRILVKDQTDASENGVYIVNTSGAWARAEDFVQGKVSSGAFFFVEEGETGGNNGFVLTTDNPISIGNTALTFTQFSGAGQVVDGAGLGKIGNEIFVKTGLGISIVADQVSIDKNVVARKVVATIDGTSTSTAFSISHSLDNEFVVAQVFRASGDRGQVETDVEHVDANTISIKLAQSPDALGLGDLKVIIVG